MLSPYSEYIKGLDQYPPLTSEEEIKLGKILNSEASFETKKQAKQKLVNHNLKWVVKVANEYKSKPGWKNTDIMDIIGAGNMGLVAAADKYSGQFGTFLAYADSWVNLFIRRTQANTGSAIRVPVHILEVVCYVAELQGYLEQILSRTPSTAEIVEAMDGAFERDRVEELLYQKSTKTVSIDSAPAGDDNDDMIYADVIESGCDSPEDTALKREKSKAIQEVLGGLPYINKRVLELTFGLTEEGERTLDEISEILYKEGYHNKGKPYTKQNISLIKIRGIELIQNNPDAINKLKMI